MQTIVTTYRGPTNTRGPRIIARAEAGSLTMPYRHELNSEGNHAEAARLLAERNGWRHQFAGGDLPGGGRWAWVPVIDRSTPVFGRTGPAST
ncbi:MAG: hypothetical protein EBR82_61800 [Caulobacteraceae bacterium]|nr:hypothetical protein [Caulobacteraceae bacterium]